VTARTHGSRVGDVTLRDWDKAVLLSIGSLLDTEKNRYYLPISIYVNDEQGGECHIDRASVIYKKMEPTLHEFDLPAILINRDDFAKAQRLFGVVEQYRVPAEGSTPVSIGDCLGATEYETKPQDRPYDFNYTFEVWSRYRNVAQVLLQMLMARYPVHGKLSVFDSLGVEREYYASQEGTSDLTEVSSLVDRIVGYSLSISIQGELTLDAVAVVDPSFTGDTSETPIDPNNPGVDPGPGGIYADGLVDVTVESLEGNDGC
jgi:hypothetical protein